MDHEKGKTSSPQARLFCAALVIEPVIYDKSQ
jgi:hypothetical protein